MWEITASSWFYYKDLKKTSVSGDYGGGASSDGDATENNSDGFVGKIRC